MNYNITTTNNNNNNTIIKSNSNGGNSDSARTVIGCHSHSNTNKDCCGNNNCHKTVNTNRKRLLSVTKNKIEFSKKEATILKKPHSICQAPNNDIITKRATATSTSRFNFSNKNDNRKAPLEECANLNISNLQRKAYEYKIKNGEEKNYDGNNNSATTVKPLQALNPTSPNLAIPTNLTASRPQQDEDLARMLKKCVQSIMDQIYQYVFAAQQSLTSHNIKSKEHDIAFQFVAKVIERHNRIQSSPKGSNLIKIIATDSLYDVTCKMIKCQQDFLNGNGYDTNTPVEVTLAYHYTHEKHIKGILKQGLHCSTRGTFGPGIYLGNNPCAFHSRARIGLIVAALKGKCERSESNRFSGALPSSGGGTVSANTTIGNRHRRHIQPATSKLSALYAPAKTLSYYDEIIMKESRQCVPLIMFHSTLVNPNEENGPGNDTVWIYHQEMQKVVNEFFNSGIPLGDRTPKSDIFPSMRKSCSSLRSPASIPSSRMRNSVPRRSIPRTVCSDGPFGGESSFANGIIGQNNYSFRGNGKIANKFPVSNKQPNLFLKKDDNKHIRGSLHSSKTKTSEEISMILSCNIPHHMYDLEMRDNAVAEIILNRYNRHFKVESALKLAGFSDYEASDDFLQRNVTDLVSEIRSHGQQLKSCDKRFSLAACHLYRKKTPIRKAMEPVGFLSREINCAESRLLVLIVFCAIIEKESRIIDTGENIINAEETKEASLQKAAHLSVIEGMAEGVALFSVGFTYHHAKDPLLCQEVKMRCCKLRLRLAKGFMSLYSRAIDDQKSLMSRKSIGLNSNDDINDIRDKQLGVQNLHARLDEVAFIITHLDSIDVTSKTIERELKFAGFTEEEISDSRNIIYVNIKSRLEKCKFVFLK